jgi:hypothetical protein
MSTILLALTSPLFFPYSVVTDISSSHVSSQLTHKPFHPENTMVAQEINKAKAFYDAYGSALLGDEKVHELLENYRRAITRTYEVMAEEIRRWIDSGTRQAVPKRGIGP